jgi:hypothetical protein
MIFYPGPIPPHRRSETWPENTAYYELASRNVQHFKWDKYSFRELCEVAVLLIQRGESPYVLDEAIAQMREAADRILDPDMSRDLHRFEMLRSQHH